MPSFFTNNSYPYKHWLTTLTIAPLMIMIYDFLNGNNNFNDAIGIFVLFVIFGFLFSLPVVVLYLLLFTILIKRVDSVLLIKIILNVFTILGVLLSIKTIGGTMMTPALSMHYSVALILCSFFFKIKKAS